MSVLPSDRHQLNGVAVLTDRDYRAVFEASPDATLIVDAKGVIRDVNPQARTMFGWSREEMEGSRVERLIPAGSRSRHEQHRLRYGEAPRARPMGQGLELSALRRDGATIPVEISLSPGELASGEEHVICTVRDITGWKRMRHLSRMMVAAAENERKRVSRELHDGFLQSLVALKIRVKLLADGTTAADRERMRGLIAEEILDTIRGVKRVIRELLPPALDHHGLSAALGSMFRDLREVYGFTVRANLDPLDGEVDAPAALALYRIVQEAVTNAMRHARVDEATVTLRSGSDLVIAEIRDEGCGFDLPDAGAEPDRSHVGLVAMRERAALVGGDVSVQTSPGKGTLVRAVVPIMGLEDRGDLEPW